MTNKFRWFRLPGLSRFSGSALQVPLLQFVAQGLIRDVQYPRSLLAVPIRVIQGSQNDFPFRLFGGMSSDFLQEQRLMFRSQEHLQAGIGVSTSVRSSARAICKIRKNQETPYGVFQLANISGPVEILESFE